MAILIGTSGWSSRQGARLASQFSVSEVRSSFHRPLERKTVERWLDLVQLYPDFRFTVVLGRQFTHERLMAGSAVAFFKEGLWPLLRVRRMGALLMKFPADFSFTVANERYLLELRRAFHEFPLVADLRHESWSTYEARAVLIDHRVGLVGDSLTSGTGFLRIPASQQNLESIEKSLRKLGRFADRTFAIFEDEAAALEMQARLSGLTIAPAQPSLNFGLAVA